MATKLSGMIAYLYGLLPLKVHDFKVTWSSQIKWKLNPLYLQYHSAYGHQTL